MPEERPATAPPSLPGYEILEELGRGGMGVVYKARQTGLNRVVALKMILGGAHGGKDMIDRFRAEAEAVARLQHPNIIQIYEISEHDGRPYFSLEFADGGSLDKRLNGAPQSPRDAAQLVETLAHAMQAAHDRGIVHRDLKPANVLLQIAECRLQNEKTREVNSAIGNLQSALPKITDFGLAKYLDADSSQTKSGVIMGTPSYMAPEQAEGKVHAIGPAADVYALGAMLYELLTGRPPFRAATPLDTVLQVVSEEPIPPLRLQSTVPRDLDTICLKCLEKDPRKRFASAADLAADLRRFLDGDAILARPTPFWERQWKWAKRRPALAALVFLFAVPLPCLLLYMSFLWRDAVAARDEAARTADREREARATVEKEHARAETHLKKALEAVDKMLVRVASERMARLPGFQEERAAILQEAVEFYQSFLRIECDEPMVRRETARAFAKLGELHQNLGRSDLSEDDCLQAIAIQVKLVEQFPDKPEYQHDLAETYTLLGFVNALINRGEAAEKAYREALRLGDQLVQRYPRVAEYRATQVDSHFGLGFYYLHTRKPQQGEPNFLEALKLAQQLVHEQPSSVNYRALHAASYSYLGTLQFVTGQIPKADETLRKALDLLQPADASALRTSKYYDQAMVTALLSMSYVHLRMGRSGQAQESLKKGIELGEELLRLYPKFYGYRIQLGIAYATLSTLNLNFNKPADAQQYGFKAMEIFDAMEADGIMLPTQFSFVNDVRPLGMYFMIRNGDYAKAVAGADKLSAKIPPTGGMAYNLACVYALAAANEAADEKLASEERQRLSEKHALQALDMLQKSRQAYLNRPQTLQHMKKDTDLDFLRSRADFIKFIGELETQLAPAEKKQ
jgi:tetratricopeptide (TPR) repeat protein